MKKQSLESELLSVLKNDSGERGIHAFLKEHDHLITSVFNPAWNSVTCIPEYSLGKEFRADFLILSADSGCWHVTLIELEKPCSRLYLNDGTESKDLRMAAKQIREWRAWVHSNEPFLRKDLSRIARRNDLPAYCSRADIHQRAETEIIDATVIIRFTYHVLIGRRDALSDDERRRRGESVVSDVPFGIATYDRLVDSAKRYDKAMMEIEEATRRNNP